MKWPVKQGNILDEPADVLICSANVGLNLTGGVGGAILSGFGDQMQDELYKYLARRVIAHVEPGDVVAMPPCGTHFKTVLHAVAIDGFYDSSLELVRKTVQKALEMSAGISARRVALVTLATGYGPMTMSQFGQAIKPLLSMELPPIEEVVICVLKDYEVDELRAVLGAEL